jgi:hypothetical protein
MKRMFEQFMELIAFLGCLFGFMWLLLIIGDSGNGTLLSRAYYYFWLELPLVVFGILTGAAEIVIKNRKSHQADK